MRRHADVLLVRCTGCGMYRRQGPRCNVPFCKKGGPTAKDLAIQHKHNSRVLRRILAKEKADAQH